MADEAQSQPDFKLTRSDLLSEIKGQLMNLNDAISEARASQRFQHNTKPSSALVYMAAYEHFDRLFGLARELLSHNLVEHAEKWLDNPKPLAQGIDKFMADITHYKRLIDAELYALGIKDTNLRQPIVFPMEFHEKEYASFDREQFYEDEVCDFSVRNTEALMEDNSDEGKKN